MNIDRLSLENGNNLSDRDYPTVVIKDRNISRELKGFLGKRFGIEKIFGQILTQFGFTKDNMIVLSNINYSNAMNLVSFEYSVDLSNDINNKVILDFNRYGEMIISDKNMDVVCHCSATSMNDIRLKIKKIEERLNNNKVFIRRYGYSNSEYSIKYFDKEIKLFLNKYNCDDMEKLLILDNGLMLEEYFKNCDINISIDDLYKDIEKYLGNIDDYVQLRLEINKYISNKKVNTDLLVLKKGVCQEFMITRDNKCVYLNGNGEWSYNYKDSFYDVSAIDMGDRNVTFSITADNDSIIKYVMDHKECVNDVTTDVDNTKKLVRTLINNDIK